MEVAIRNWYNNIVDHEMDQDKESEALEQVKNEGALLKEIGRLSGLSEGVKAELRQAHTEIQLQQVMIRELELSLTLTLTLTLTLIGGHDQRAGVNSTREDSG